MTGKIVHSSGRRPRSTARPVAPARRPGALPEPLFVSRRPAASLGWVVCNLRERAGFTIQELAPRAGLTPARLAAIEHDCAGTVTREEIEALARVVIRRLLIVGLEGL